MHLLCDGNGLPLAAEILAGPVHESKPERVHSLLAVIPEKRLPKGRKRRRSRLPSCLPQLYRRRNAIERLERFPIG